MARREQLKKIVSDMNRRNEDFWREQLGLDKVQKVTTGMLKDYVFDCACCKEEKSASEAVLLTKDFTIDQKVKNDKMVYKVTQEIAVICQDCLGKLVIKTSEKVGKQT